MNEPSLPLTGLCIVEQTCPAGYVMLDKCDDNPRVEADLWKDNLFSRKVKRFLCVTRVFPLAGGSLNNVLIDLSIHDEKDPPPTGHSALSSTQDTSEPSMKKKCLSAKLVARSQATDAITDIMFLCKQRKAPPGYTLVGELNGLTLCFKVGKVPTQNAPPPIPPSYETKNTVYTGLRPPQIIQQQQQHNQYTGNHTVQSVTMQGHPAPMYSTGATTVSVAPARQGSTREHPLSGVPFEINPRLVSSGRQQSNLGNFSFKSRGAIMSEFDYPFVVENQAQQTSAHFNGL